MEGQIIKIISDLHIVNFNGTNYNCKCRGIFRKRKTIPLVGDYVKFNPDKNLIEEIMPRKNEFKRPKVANIDQGVLVTSLKTPDFSLNLLDKLITLMELHQVKPIICITKKDLVEKEYLDSLKPILNYYKELGYEVVFNTDLDKLTKDLTNKTTVFTGQTGAGKSTLLNKLNPTYYQEVGEVSESLGRGRHTTRVVELFFVGNGKILDTPGFSALDFFEYSKEDIRDSFIEFKNYSCPYHDCMHLKEENCEVKNAVKNNNILESRYKNYVKLLERK